MIQWRVQMRSWGLTRYQGRSERLALITADLKRQQALVRDVYPPKFETWVLEEERIVGFNGGLVMEKR
ncbi:hypothetical protein J7643_02660 [bacterium]|nr:hypothetical protein [bacterium]